MSREATTELCPSALPNIPPLKIRKNALIQHRLRKINKIQKRLKHEQSERKTTRFVKKIEMLQREIELLTNGCHERSTGKQKTPSTAVPVKTSSLAPNKESVEREKMVDARTIQDWKMESKVDTSMGEYFSSEQPKRDLSGNGLRMNVFEKLGFCSEDDSGSCEVSTSSDSTSTDGSSDSKTSESVNEPTEEALKNVFERKDELDALRFRSERSVDCEDNEEFSENVDVLVKSADTSSKDRLEYETVDKMCNPTENPRKAYKKSSAVPKRKQLNGVFNGLSAKRRCKTLPRKVVWKYDPRPLLFDESRQKTEGEKMNYALKKKLL